MALTKVKGSVWDSRDNFLFVNVKDYGAVGDGVVDDTIAVQAAIDDINSSYLGGTFGGGAGILFFPSGKYALKEIIQKKGVKFLGEGSAQTVFLALEDGKRMLRNPSKDSQLAVDVLSQCSIEGIGFGAHPSNPLTTSTVLFDSTGYLYCTFRDLTFVCPSNVIGVDNSDNQPAGSGGPSSWYTSWYDVQWRTTGGIGARFGTDNFSFEQVTDQRFFGGSVKGTSGIGMHVRAGTGFNWHGTTFEGLNSGGNYTLIIGDTPNIRTSTSNNLFGCYLEQARILYNTNTNRCKRWGTFETTVSVTDNGTRNGRVDTEQLYLGWPKALASCRITGGSSPVLSRQYNIASIVRTGQGIFDITFTQAMPNLDYVAIASPESGDAIPRISTKTTGACRVVFENRANTFTDPTSWSFITLDHP